MVRFVPGALHLSLDLYPDHERHVDYRMYPDQQAISGTLYTPVGRFDTDRIPLTEAEGQQLLGLLQGIAARINQLVNTPAPADDEGRPS